MFYWQPGKQKYSPEVMEIRKNIEAGVQRLIPMYDSDPEEFNITVSGIKQVIGTKSIDYIEALVDTIGVTFENTTLDSKGKYAALILLKELMETNMPLLISYVEEEMLEKMRQFALFDNANPNVEERGRSLLKQYNPEVDEEYSSKFYHLSIECLVKWAIKFPIANSSPTGPSKYVETVADISRARVRLPNQSALQLYDNPNLGEPEPKVKSSKSLVVSRQPSNVISETMPNLGVSYLQPPLSSKQSHQDLANAEIRESKLQIAEGIQSMRDHSGEFMAKLRMYDPPTENFIGKLFAECIKVYGHYKPIFELVLKSNDLKFKAERRAINNERNFVNKSHGEFQQLKKGMMDMKVFLANTEQHYSKYLLTRKNDQGTPDVKSERSKSPVSHTSFKFSTNDPNLGLSQPALMQSQVSQRLSNINMPPAKESMQEVISRTSSKGQSLPLQALQASIYSKSQDNSMAKSVIEFFNEPFPAQITTGGLKEGSMISRSNRDFFQNDFNFLKNNQAETVLNTTPQQNIDFFKAPQNLMIPVSLVSNQNDFAGFNFPSQEQQPQKNFQNFFDSTSQVKNNLREIAQVDHHQPRNPISQPEITQPDLAQTYSSPKSIQVNPVADTNIYRDISHSRVILNQNGTQELVQQGVNRSRLNISRQTLTPNVASTVIEKQTIAPTQNRSTVTPKNQSNVIIGNKPAKIDTPRSQKNHSSNDIDVEQQVWFSEVNESPQEHNHLPEIVTVKQESPRQSDSSHPVRHSTVQQQQSSIQRQWMEEQSLAHQAQQAEIDDLRVKVKSLLRSLYDKDEVDRRQRRTAEEERLKWEDSMRKLERENRELRAREKARNDLDEDHRAELSREKQEVESLIQELHMKNNEILSYQRQLSAIEMEAKEKIIQHLGLIDKLKEQYHKVVQERDDQAETNARNKVQAKLYLQEEDRNKALRLQVETQSQEINRLKSNLYLSTDKCMNQEKQILEQVEIIKNCEEQVERSKSNFSITLRQLNQSHEKERVSLIESHQRELNRLMTRNRELEIQAIHKVTSNLKKYNEPPSPSTDLAIEGILRGLEADGENNAVIDKNYIINLENQMKHLKEESIKATVDLGFLNDEIKKKDEAVEESQGHADRLNRQITELKEQNYQMVKDFYSKEKALNDMSQRHSAMMRKYTDMHKQLETVQKTEAQLRRELNEYHSRLMRLDAKYTSEMEEFKIGDDNGAEFNKAKVEISNLESIVRRNIDEAVDLKRQLVESQANEEVLQLRIVGEKRRYALLENDKDSLGDHIYQLKQKLSLFEKKGLNEEFSQAALVRISKENKMLEAQVEMEQQKVTDLKNMLEKLSIVEELKQKLREVESVSWEIGLGRFVDNLQGKLDGKENNSPLNQVRLEKPGSPTKSQSPEKSRLPFISWEEFNKNYNKFLAKGILYPSDLPTTTETRNDILTLAPLAISQPKAMNETTSKISERIYIDHDKQATDHIDEDEYRLKHTIKTDNIDAMIDDGIRAYDSKVVLEQMMSDIDKQEIEFFFKTYNRDDVAALQDLNGSVVGSPPAEAIDVSVTQAPIEISAIMESASVKKTVCQKVDTVNSDPRQAISPKQASTGDDGRVPDRSDGIRQRDGMIGKSMAAGDQLDWTTDDMKMFEGMENMTGVQSGMTAGKDFEFDFGADGQDGCSEGDSGRIVEKRNEFFQSEADKNEIENYMFEDQTPEKDRGKVKKSFKGVENIIKETPEQPQFKDYCQHLELCSQKASDKSQFKETCVARSGVFSHILDLNLILKSGTIELDHKNTKLSIEVVLVTQDPIEVTSIKLVNYGNFG